MLQVFSISSTYSSSQNGFSGIGQRTIEVRLAGCNLRCANCPSPQTLSPESALLRMTPEMVFQEISVLSRHQISHVTICGGEPLAQWTGLVQLVWLLQSALFHTTIETNGSYELLDTNYRDQYKTRFVVSYKLPCSRMDQLMTTQFLSVFPNFGEFDIFKFKIASHEDEKRVKELIHLNKGIIPADRIYLSVDPHYLPVEYFLKRYNNDQELSQYPLSISLNQLLRGHGK